MEGWMYLFWAELLAVVQSVVVVVYVGGGFVGAIIGLLIGFYILFELRSAYKEKVKKEK